MQIMLFFLLGLLVFPSKIPAVIFKGVLISIFMILVAQEDILVITSNNMEEIEDLLTV